MLNKVFLICCALFLSCTLVEEEKEWDNIFDPDGTKYHAPVVSVMDDTTVAIYDTVILHASGSDEDGGIEKFEWSFNEKLTWSAESNSNGKLARFYTKSDTGEHTIWVRAVDAVGLKSKPDKFLVEVKLFRPTVKAMDNIVVAVKDTVTFTATGTDENGTVESFLWNGPNWDTTTQTGKLKRYFPVGSEGSSVIWVKVVDDDTLESAPDGFGVEVKLYKPYVTLPEKEEIKINDTLTLTAKGGDSNGVVINYLWALDGKNFDHTTEENKVKLVYSDSGHFTVRVLVTDDDGYASTPAAVEITVTLDTPVPEPVEKYFIRRSSGPF